MNLLNSVAVLICLYRFRIYALNIIESTNCTDYADFIQFQEAYDVSGQIKNIPVFKYVSSGQSNINGQIEYNCEDVFKYKNEQSCTENPIDLETLQTTDSQYVQDLSMNGEIRVSSFFFHQSSCNNPSGQQYTVWTAEDLNTKAKQPCTCGQYGNDNCELAFSKYKKHINGKKGFVIGSYLNWAEAAALKYGAKRVTTIEYNRIYSAHKKVVAITPFDYASQYLNASGSKKKFQADFIISYSSLEHDGLGRYGDPLNAFGDLLSFAKCNCMLKQGGVLFLGLPIGKDEVQFNAHRIYGYRRLSILFALGFEILDIISVTAFTINTYDNGDSTQPVIVLRKK